MWHLITKLTCTFGTFVHCLKLHKIQSSNVILTFFADRGTQKKNNLLVWILEGSAKTKQTSRHHGNHDIYCYFYFNCVFRSIYKKYCKKYFLLLKLNFVSLNQWYNQGTKALFTTLFCTLVLEIWTMIITELHGTVSAMSCQINISVSRLCLFGL